jgi:hypothetical protein
VRPARKHARLGGDLELASGALCDAAGRAAERFDHAAAEALLDEAITLHPTGPGSVSSVTADERRLRRRPLPDGSGGLARP